MSHTIPLDTVGLNLYSIMSGDKLLSPLPNYIRSRRANLMIPITDVPHQLALRYADGFEPLKAPRVIGVTAPDVPKQVVIVRWGLWATRTPWDACMFAMSWLEVNHVETLWHTTYEQFIFNGVAYALDCMYGAVTARATTLDEDLNDPYYKPRWTQDPKLMACLRPDTSRAMGMRQYNKRHMPAPPTKEFTSFVSVNGPTTPPLG